MRKAIHKAVIRMSSDDGYCRRIRGGARWERRNQQLGDGICMNRGGAHASDEVYLMLAMSSYVGLQATARDRHAKVCAIIDQRVSLGLGLR